MKQVIQNLKSGKVELKDVPTPACGAGEILVATRASLISAGTERMVMDFAGKSMVGKAKERPDLVRKVMAKMQRDGVVDTLASVFARLDEPLPLGYSAAGEVVAVGSKLANEFAVGDRVAVAGATLANHAEYNAIPKNLAVKLPDSVPFEHGCFATLAAIAMHGVRNADVKLGDRVLVVGLGLVGQLAVQIAAAAGARVAGVDPNLDRGMLAKQGGALWATGPAGLAKGWQSFTDGRGFDAILICAATESDGPIEQAAEWARDRATVILVGKVGTQFPYATYMKKELTVRVSRSYGPGRYDPAFENQGLSYPVGFVPWTERENLGEAVRLMAKGAINPAILTTHTFNFDEALKGYALIQSGQSSMGVVLGYAEKQKLKSTTTFETETPTPRGGGIGVSLIGAGAFARAVVLPALANISGWQLRGVVSKGGLSAAHVADKYKAVWADTNAERALTDTNTHAVMVMTRHNMHATQVVSALKSGKHVWVEKPLALNLKDIAAVEATAQKAGTALMVGFNRRFSPALIPLKRKLTETKGPKQILVRANAGRLEEGGWQHSAEGGGRLLGEVCHFTDLCLWLAGSELTSVEAQQGNGQDNYIVTLRFEDGSMASVFYSSEGDSGYAKERVEVFGGGATGVMDNYQSTVWSENGRAKKLYRKPFFTGQEKGHAPALAAWLRACAGSKNEIPSVEALCNSSRVVLWAEESIRTGKAIRI